MDTSGVDNMLRKIEDRDTRRRIMLDGLAAGAKVLQESTMQHIRSSWSGSTHASHDSRMKGKPIYEGVRLRKDKDFCEVLVDIKGDYTLRFYENQTKERKTKKGYNRGVVGGYHFFRSARNDSEQQVMDAISKKVTEELNTILNQ